MSRKPPELPEQFFKREDESSDDLFYVQPRFETHIDDSTIENLTAYYREALDPNDRILDLMSSWISHLPPEIRYQQISGLGMNEAELARNERLDDYVVHDLNETPTLPYPENSFDVVTIVVSIQYLIRPFEVFEEIARVLAPGGRCIVAMSHRLFPTKAVFAFQMLPPEDRCRMVAAYMKHTEQFAETESIDRSPPVGDPLWLVKGTHR